MTKILIRLGILLVVIGMVAGGFYLVQQIPEDESTIPLAQVKRGDLVVKTFLRGELRAVRSLTLIAPNIGTQSQITQLAPAGSLANRGNLIFELDDSERVAALEDSLLSVEKINEDLKKAETELDIRKSQDEVEIVRSNFQVRRAELEVRRNELISEIDARKNVLTLEEARRRKQKLEEDIKNRLQQREAELAVLREQLNKAQLDVDRDRKRIEQSRVLAPMTGLVSVLQNRSGGRGGFGQSTPDIREGDQIPAGMSVAQLLDLSEMELVTKVEEVERANLQENQTVVIRLDALPGKEVQGKIQRLGNTATTNIFAGEATKKFECVISIDMRQLLTHVGADDERIARIMATARANAATGYGLASASGRGGGQRAGRAGGAAAGGQPGGGEQVRAGGGQGGGRQARAGGQGQRGQQQAQGGGRQGGQRGPGGTAGGPGQAGGQGGGGQQRAGGRGGAGGGNSAALLARLPEEARKKAEALLKGRGPQDLSDEERQQFRQIMQAAFQGGAGGGRPGGGAGGFGGAGGGRPGAGGAPGGGPGGGAGGFGGGAGGFGGAGGGRAGGRAGGGPGGGAPSGPTSSGSEFNEAQRKAAVLPRPPEEGSDIDILLRPGLLADAEVIVENLPDTLYIPFQAVFEDGTHSVVYVLEEGRLQPRRVTLGKRSESQIAITDGLSEGEMIALQAPESAGGAAPKKAKKKSSGPSFPTGGGGNGRRGG
jgi:biotin carboxyl carrier protein